MSTQRASVRRPGPFQWLRYAFGAGLPSELNDWVLRDTTGRTWAVRHFVRGIVQLAPLVVLTLVFVPGPFWIRGVAVAAASFMGLLFCLAYMTETSDHRLVKAGFPVGTGQAIRQGRRVGNRTQQTAQRLERIDARRARRRLNPDPPPSFELINVSDG